MANTFFGFDSGSIDNDGNALHGHGDEVGCADTEEDEYDALNDETFGGLGDTTDGGLLDDWEQQHEQFAEFAENKKHSDDLENSLSQLVLDDSDDSLPSGKEFTDWSYPPTGKNGDIFNSQLLSSLQRTVSATTHTIDAQNAALKWANKSMRLPVAAPVITNNQVPKKICTVEELERGLRPQNKQQTLPQLQQQPSAPPSQPVLSNMLPNHPYFQQHQQGLGGPPRLPPGLHHNVPMPPPPGLRHMPPGLHPANMPPGFPRMMPPPPPHPAYGNMMYGGNPLPFPPFNFPPPRNGNPNLQHHQMARHQQQQQHQQQQHQQQQNMRNINNNLRLKAEQLQQQQQQHHQHETMNKDEYAGLMTNREKQWLLNIQQLQLNTGTPYFDDYYYTVFKERKVRNNKENQPDRNQRYQRNHRNNHHHQHHQDNPLTPRVYTPLQFENSLGKLQCGSVTAPRKIIDMDVVTLEKDAESTPNRDTRKTKQLLLELEGLYSLMLKAEDLRNPLAISNMEKLLELKQKQRLRELEAAPTPEQKQEVLKLLQQESIVQVDNPTDYINKIMSNLMQDDKFTSYLNIRKGKLLLLRILPHLTTDAFAGSFTELWLKVLLSLPTIGRRDTIGDNILPRLHPYFKRYLHNSSLPDILEIVSNLAEVTRLENSRSTPLSHQGRAPLYFVASNKFGVTALVMILMRAELLMSSSAEAIGEKQLDVWTDFVVAWADLGSDGRCPIAVPDELIPHGVFDRHAVRIPRLGEDKKQLLEKFYVDVN